MREIKFRAWHKEEKKLCEIDVINLEQGAFLKGVAKGIDQYIDSTHVILTPNNGRFCKFNEMELMQYTGLKDKNGKEIYEGDILTFNGNMTADNSFGFDPNGYIYDENSIHSVKWNKELSGWEPEFNDEEEWKYKRDTRSLMVTGNCEVIGNIHENPELLIKLTPRL